MSKKPDKYTKAALKRTAQAKAERIKRAKEANARRRQVDSQPAESGTFLYWGTSFSKTPLVAVFDAATKQWSDTRGDKFGRFHLLPPYAWAPIPPCPKP